MGKALVKLVKKVKKMEDVLKRRHVVLPDSEDEDADISSKQGRNLREEALDEMVRNMMKDKSEVFKTPTQSKTSREEDISPTTLEAAKTLSKVASQRTKSVDKGKRYKKRKESKGKDISTGFEDISTGLSISMALKKGLKLQKKLRTIFKQEEASLAEAIRLQTLEEEETAKQVHLDALLAKRKEEEELIEQQSKKSSRDMEAYTVKEGSEKDIERLSDRNFKETKIDVSETEEKGVHKEIHETDKEESVEANDPTPLDTKSNIVANWKIFQQGERSIYQIIRANGADTVYMSFGAMLKDFTREDLIELYRLVMQKYGYKNRAYEIAYDSSTIE
ncbi:hypothetical protein Tco_1003750 [Tanacetum coccineum]|uniref:Uncharacterized protein n=1 Tax=Tanacetum coccineum TaxID=301880 RepID=A0ABQ5FC85_9ASTR